MGYHHSPEETELAFDENNCLKTGDLGKVDKDGFYYITGNLLAFDHRVSTSIESSICL